MISSGQLPLVKHPPRVPLFHGHSFIEGGTQSRLTRNCAGCFFVYCPFAGYFIFGRIPGQVLIPRSKDFRKLLMKDLSDKFASLIV